MCKAVEYVKWQKNTVRNTGLYHPLLALRGHGKSCMDLFLVYEDSEGIWFIFWWNYLSNMPISSSKNTIWIVHVVELVSSEVCTYADVCKYDVFDLLKL